MKTSELTGSALDWAVAKCEGENSVASCYYDDDTPLYLDEAPEPTWNPSTNWAQGGPIIEREKIEIFLRDEQWFAYSSFSLPMDFPGDSPLIAAMRCYVAGMRGSHIELTGAEHE